MFLVKKIKKKRERERDIFHKKVPLVLKFRLDSRHLVVGHHLRFPSRIAPVKVELNNKKGRNFLSLASEEGFGVYYQLENHTKNHPKPQNRKKKKIESNQKLHAKPSKPINFHHPVIKPLIDPARYNGDKWSI